MGEWYTSCAFSGLTIRGHRAGVVFVHSGYDTPVYGACYPIGFCDWITPPLWGSVDCCGRLDIDPGEDAQIVDLSCRALDSLSLVTEGRHRARMAEKVGAPVGVAGLHDVQVAIHDAQHLTGTDPIRGKLQVGYLIVREDVWRTLVEMAEDKVKAEDVRKYVTTARGLRAVHARIASGSPHPEVRDVADELLTSRKYNPLRWYTEMEGAPMAFYELATKTGNADLSDALITRFLEVRRVQRAMSMLRLPLLPGCGLGSQSSTAHARLEWFTAMADIARADVAELDAEEDEDA